MINEEGMDARQYVNHLAGTKVVVNLTSEERENFIRKIENGASQERILQEIKDLKTSKFRKALNDIIKILEDNNSSQEDRIMKAKARAVTKIFVGQF